MRRLSRGEVLLLTGGEEAEEWVYMDGWNDDDADFDGRMGAVLFFFCSGGAERWVRRFAIIAALIRLMYRTSV